jgi:hypothetical protein
MVARTVLTDSAGYYMLVRERNSGADSYFLVLLNIYSHCAEFDVLTAVVMKYSLRTRTQFYSSP